ncbi:hypothetical protein FRC11_014194 [Ceratobasidium sp. 423]|nr:hypothetical protein FRC11_014194 [Ceratobasidium sp. 423]
MDRLDTLGAFAPMYLAPKDDGTYDPVMRNADNPHYTSLHSDLLNLRQELREQNPDKYIPQPPLFPSKKQAFNYDQYRMATAVYRDDVMKYLQEIEPYRHTSRNASPRADQELRNLSNSLSPGSRDRTVTMRIPGSMPPTSPPVPVVSPPKDRPSAPPPSRPFEHELPFPPQSPSVTSSAYPASSPEPFPKRGNQSRKAIPLPPVRAMNPSESEEQSSSNEERIPPPKLDSDVEQIPRPPSTIDEEPVDTTVYVMDSNWTNTGHAMVPWYEGFQGEKRFYKRHRDGNYERIPGPGEELTTLRSKSYSPEVPLYTIWNSEMVPYNPMIHEWDADTYFLRGDGRYQKWKLPRDPNPPLIISWPPPKVDPSPLGIDPVFITINIGDNEDTSHLPPPIQPTVLHQPTTEPMSIPVLTPQKRIEAPPQHQPTSATKSSMWQNREQVETPSKSGRIAWSSHTGRDSDSPLTQKLPQAPTNKPATTISTPAPKRPVTLEDLPESPTLFHAPPPTLVHTQASPKLSELPKPTFIESPPATSTPRPLHPGFSRK